MNLENMFTFYGFLLYIREIVVQNYVQGLSVAMVDEMIEKLKVDIAKAILGTK